MRNCKSFESGLLFSAMKINHGFLCYNQAFSALLLCSCSREHINELSPLNSMPEPWPLPYGIFGTPKAQERVDVSRRSEGIDCTLQPMGDHLAHQSHYLFKFWEVSKIGFCSLQEVGADALFPAIPLCYPMGVAQCLSAVLHGCWM